MKAKHLIAGLLLALCASQAYSATFRYYRLTTITSYNADNIDWSQLSAQVGDYLLSLGGSPMDSTGHSVTASTTDAGSPASNLLDGDPTTAWSSDTDPVEVGHPHTLIYDATTPTEIDRILLSNRDGIPWGAIGEYEIHGSNDLSGWTLIGSGTANPLPPVSEATVTLMVSSDSALLLRRRR
jgi:chitinase